jgi:hypothetical protein
MKGASGITILGLVKDENVLVLLELFWLFVPLLMRVFMVVGRGLRGEDKGIETKKEMAKTKRKKLRENRD